MCDSHHFPLRNTKFLHIWVVESQRLLISTHITRVHALSAVTSILALAADHMHVLDAVFVISITLGDKAQIGIEAPQVGLCREMDRLCWNDVPPREYRGPSTHVLGRAPADCRDHPPDCRPVVMSHRRDEP